jgi:hypothetical protein
MAIRTKDEKIKKKNTDAFGEKNEDSPASPLSSFSSLNTPNDEFHEPLETSTL